MQVGCLGGGTQGELNMETATLLAWFPQSCGKPCFSAGLYRITFYSMITVRRINDNFRFLCL